MTNPITYSFFFHCSNNLSATCDVLSSTSDEIGGSSSELEIFPNISIGHNPVCAIIF